MASKKNKDGLVGGSLVGEKDFLEVTQKKRKAAKVEAKVKAETEAKAKVEAKAPGVE